jgi:hypothetical protein
MSFITMTDKTSSLFERTRDPIRKQKTYICWFGGKMKRSQRETKSLKPYYEGAQAKNEYGQEWLWGFQET